MTTVTYHHRAGSAGLRAAVLMEWHKLRTVRSTWYVLAGFAVTMVGLAVLIVGHENYAHLSAADRAAFDPTRDSFIGLVLGQLLVGTLGVLTITSEFSSGTIGSTFAVAPRRSLVLTAKTAALGAVTLAVGEVSAFASFLAGHAALAASAPHPALGEPGVLRAVLMAGAYPALTAVFGLGVGAVVRHTAGAVCALVGALFVVSVLFATLSTSIQQVLPNTLRNSLTTVVPAGHMLAAGPAFCLMCGYAVAALAAGAWALTRRDA
jgi:hypothetical protein